jgi:hypothetical protein
MHQSVINTLELFKSFLDFVSDNFRIFKICFYLSHMKYEGAIGSCRKNFFLLIMISKDFYEQET